MINYNKALKNFSRKLRSNSTDAERLLWSRLRRKQLLNVQFYRQKPIGSFIVDFYAPEIKLIIEVDGGQHFEKEHIEQDRQRDMSLGIHGLKVLRFDNLQVLKSITQVLEVIFQEITGRLPKNISI